MPAQPDQEFWDKRYSQADFVFGLQANTFLASVAGKIPPGPVLSVGEGEGRNAIFLAQAGHDVLAVDLSDVGLAKLRKRAGEMNLPITTRQADLNDFVIEPGRFAGIVSIFCHLPSSLRRKVHRAISDGLQPGGVFILEAYTPRQLGKGTGGPSDVDMLLTLDLLKTELPALEFLHAVETDRDIREGAAHGGWSSVVQLLAKKPR